MKSRFALALVLFASLISANAEPLRVFLRAGPKTHGPNQHDHPRFLQEWTKLLGARGMKVDGGMDFPTAAQLEQTDVLVIYAQDGMNIVGEQRANFESFLKRGGGLVVLHDGVVSADQHVWARQVLGGAWRWDLPTEKRTKWYEGDVGMYFVNPENPIVKGVSNFDWKDEIYYDMDMAPDVKVLATSFHSVFVIAPQIWTYEKTWPGGATPYRAFVSLPGHEFDVFNTPHYRAILMRGIAWAGKRPDVDEFCVKEELASLKYPVGGPVPPEKAAATFNVHPDFTVNLVAAEPLIEKVISLDWAPDGKLWIAETPEYPGGRTINRNDQMVALWNVTNPEAVKSGNKEDRPARDRISWLEDTDGDGRMDKKHVFADFEHGVPGGLERVTSLVFYKDGVIVAQAPDILWIRDTDGDGVADKVEKLYTGFGNFDTHAVINNFRWGMDGWIYGAVGYSAGDPKSGDGSKSFGRITAGIIRFKPDGSALEQYASGSCNTWGFDFSPSGEAFYTTATCGEHFLHIVMPEKVLARGNVGDIRASWVIPDHQKVAPAVHHTRPAYVQIDWVGMFTAAAGCCIYNGGAWPEKYRHMGFCSETTVSLVHNEMLAPNGVTFSGTKEKGREDTEFLTSTDLWFRPIHERIGPDGALYIVDFYNQAAIHNDTRGPAHGAHNAATRPDRDHHLGRIWRVQHKQPAVLPPWKLDPQDHPGLVKMLEHPNGWVRGTAGRLLLESGDTSVVPALIALIRSNAAPVARINALYALNNLGRMDGEVMHDAVNDPEPLLRKNALRIVSEYDNSGISPDIEVVKARLKDTDPRSRLNALIALGTFELSPEIAQALVQTWPDLKDKYLQSAAIGVAGREPLLFIQAAFEDKDPAFLAEFIGYVTRVTANRQDAELAAKLVTLIAKEPATTDGLKQSALETLTTTLKADVTPMWTPELQSAFAALLKSSRPGLPGAALPLVVRWDKNGSLASELRPVISHLSARLGDKTLSDDERGQIAVNLVGVRKLDPAVIPSVAALLGGDTSAGLQKRVVEALGSTGDAAAGDALIAAYPRVPVELHEAVFGTIIKRSDWTSALLQAMTDKKIDPLTLGPANLHRLRTHSDKLVAAKANEVIDELRGPEQKQKDALIAQLRPEVEKRGDVANGHAVFLANCSGCHIFKTEGRNLAPNLTGMGAHGPAELLVHIVDPNRLVEPNFVSTSIETKDDLSYDGIIERENNVELVLRNATGDYTIRKDNIRSRASTARSLMPEGFEALGPGGLRDLLSYICADEDRFRILDLSSAFTANTSRGIYISEEAKDESLRFRRFGTIKVGDVPFDIVSPTKSQNGNNVIVLKGGSGLAKTFPQKVEIKAGLRASRVHFLGGIGGWAWPYDGERAKGLPAARITLHFTGGGTEEIVLKNGVEIADYIAKNDVPGSEEVPDLLQNGRQVRWFSKSVKGKDVIDHITIESFDNIVAPTFVAITAETGEAPRESGPSGGATGTSAATTSPAVVASGFQWGPGIKTLIVGGGSSHDFNRWFNEADSKTLSEGGNASVHYTENPNEILPALKSIDVLYQSSNQPMPDAAMRKGIFDFADSGKGLLLVHPGLWYNWPDWPEYNRNLVGGGSRGHDKYEEFEVTVTRPDHPIMKGVPATFTIADELYNHVTAPDGAPALVLATGKSPISGKIFPVVWITQHPKARIVCITLGHDGKAHSNPAYQTILRNGLAWAAGK